MPLEGRAYENHSFHTTQWSMVLSAGGPTSDSSQQALSLLCERYYYPVYAFIRKRGHSAADAEDLTQGFFEKLLSQSSLSHADPDRGRFRCFLMTAAQNFLHSDYRKKTAQKRGGGTAPFSLDYMAAESRYANTEPSSEAADPETLFMREWARTLIGKVTGQLRLEQTAAKKQALVDHLLDSHLWDDSDAVPYPQLAEQYGTSLSNVKVTAYRLRGRFRDLLRAEVAATLNDESEFEDEWKYLMGLFSR